MVLTGPSAPAVSQSLCECRPPPPLFPLFQKIKSQGCRFCAHIIYIPVALREISSSCGICPCDFSARSAPTARTASGDWDDRASSASSASSWCTRSATSSCPSPAATSRWSPSPGMTATVRPSGVVRDVFFRKRKIVDFVFQSLVCAPGTPTSDLVPEKEFPDPPVDLTGAVPVDDPSNSEYARRCPRSNRDQREAWQQICAPKGLLTVLLPRSGREPGAGHAATVLHHRLRSDPRDRPRQLRQGADGGAAQDEAHLRHEGHQEGPGHG